MNLCETCEEVFDISLFQCKKCNASICINCVSDTDCYCINCESSNESNSVSNCSDYYYKLCDYCGIKGRVLNCDCCESEVCRGCFVIFPDGRNVCLYHAHQPKQNGFYFYNNLLCKVKNCLNYATFYQSVDMNRICYFHRNCVCKRCNHKYIPSADGDIMCDSCADYMQKKLITLHLCMLNTNIEIPNEIKNIIVQKIYN
jgi:hypothetical protein